MALAEFAIQMGAKSLLLSVACCRQLRDFSDEMAAKIDTKFYQHRRAALLRTLAD